MEIKLVGTETNDDCEEVGVAFSIADISKGQESWQIAITKGDEKIIECVVTNIRKVLNFIYLENTNDR